MTQIRSNHRYAYRPSEWGTIIGECNKIIQRELRRCYIIEWPDGRRDVWPKDDPNAAYEFTEEPPTNIESVSLIPIQLPSVTGLTLIDAGGIAASYWDISVDLSLQDDGHTLKVFVKAKDNE